MAATSYTPIQYKPTTTANNQNTMANPYTSAWGTNSAPTAQRPPSGPYNPNPPQPQQPQGPPPTKVDPHRTGPYNPNPSQTQQPSPWGQPPTPTPYTPGQAPGPWTPPPATPAPYTPYTPQAPQSYPNPNNTAGNPWTPADFNTQALRDQYTAYMQANLPYMQFMQNNQQYSGDFNESARRFDTQNQWQQQMDQYNMGLTGRQQTFAEWQSQEAANQWGAQFGQQQANDLFSQGLATNQQAIDQAYNEGRLSNEQRTIALNELAQREAQAYQYENLAQQMGWNREELAAVVANQQRQDSLARWQQEQQAQQQQAQIAADRNNAILAATGRAAGMAPSTTWMRRF